MTERPTFAAKHQGFSLLEVLVAFSVLAISMGVLFTLFSTGLRNISVAQNYSKAVIIAESKLSEVGTTSPLVVGEYQGALDEQYHWQTVITDYLVDDQVTQPGSQPHTYQVTVTVSWGDETHPRSVVLTTLRYANG